MENNLNQISRIIFTTNEELNHSSDITDIDLEFFGFLWDSLFRHITSDMQLNNTFMSRQLSERELRLANRNSNRISFINKRQSKSINDNEICSICLNSLKYDKNEKPVQLSICKHYFHDSCLHEWLNTKLNCPICRHKTIKQ